ncbi:MULTISPECIES: cytochrome b562 [Edwardsiella]|uniref:Soluble cytochrome b562 n=2 Tax=Edwardsiella anguillarum TaxID=1821960 RepID=A0A076LQ20_9GAMM|nr:MULTISPECIES: cytochrome b562 [Edwardsiella]AIJ08693.1 soluble cytochrome b562 [Edwardsiella anguillarum ET080813]AKR76724.1 cytochrome b562 [Edwardsiella sp. LADL05-105]KAB0592866.1 cytochrome b562 [Edwardsiella anguillarum]UOU79623.1 cytochrome b562 [Edwardsiella anguillarum]WHP80758.1 cytochrome b562 [Edwardsiella anguillarum]
MRKSVLALAGLAMMAGSALAQAASVSEDMDVINQSYRQAQQATTAQDFKQALTAMRAATTAAKSAVPSKLQGQASDSADMKDYRHGLDLLIGQIDKVEKLADAGQLDQAKAEAQQMLQTRNVYHKKYR